MKLASILVASALATALVTVAACTTTTTTTTTSSSEAGAPKADGGKDGGSSGSSGSSGGEEEDETPPATSTCGEETGQQACIQCCAGEHQTGAAVYQAATIACICKDENCATECETTYCASTPKNPDTACNTCAQGKLEACGPEVGEACGGDQDCVAFNNCLVDAKCATKK